MKNMPIPASINDLSTTAGSNSPAGSESPSLIDDYLRTYAAYIAQLRDAAQSNGFSMATAGGTANAITAIYSPAVTVLSDSTMLFVKAAAVNTGATTFSPNGLTAKPIVTLAYGALQGGEIVANGEVCLQYNSSVGSGSWILIYSTGGAMQGAAIVAGARNTVMSVTAASASATLTANEVVVKPALGSSAWTLGSFSKTINLATTGAGGMDVGAAPASGFVCLYAIYNPTTMVSALLACNHTTSSGSVYTGANMPSGYVASALIGVWGTNASSQFKIGVLRNRTVSFAEVTVATSATAIGSPVPMSLAAAVPLNAVSFRGCLSCSNGSSVTMGIAIAADAASTGSQRTSGVSSLIVTPYECPIIAPQGAFWSASSGGGTPSFAVTVSSFKF